VHATLTVHERSSADAASGAVASPAARAAPVRLRLAVVVPQVQALKMELSRVTGSVGSALVRRRRRRVRPSLLLAPRRAARARARPLTRRRARAAPQSASVAAVVAGGCELEARAARRTRPPPQPLAHPA
jgi:hypothetical protein